MTEIHKRRTEMKKDVRIVFIALSFVISLFLVDRCTCQVEKKFNFRVDNCKSKSFGFDCPEMGGEGVGPCSISIHDSLGFIVDSYFRNVKEVDLNDGKVLAVTDSNEGGGFVDVAVFDDRVLISCYQNLLYVYDMDFSKLDSVVIGQPGEWMPGATWWPANGHFYWSADSLFLYCNEGHVYEVSLEARSARLLASRMPADLVGREPSAHGKRCTFEKGPNGYLLHAGKHEVKMKSDINKMVHCYDATNLDFDNSRIVFFSISSKELNLYVYYYTRP